MTDVDDKFRRTLKATVWYVRRDWLRDHGCTASVEEVSAEIFSKVFSNTFAAGPTDPDYAPRFLAVISWVESVWDASATPPEVLSSPK